MQSTSPKYAELINNQSFAAMLENSGIYEAKDEGVNYIYNEKVYNIAAFYKDGTTEKMGDLFIRIMGENEFFLQVYYGKSFFYNGISGALEKLFQFEEAFQTKADKNIPSPQFKQVLNDDFRKFFSPRCPNLMPGYVKPTTSKKDDPNWKAIAFSGLALLLIAFVGYQIKQAYWNRPQVS